MWWVCCPPQTSTARRPRASPIKLRRRTWSTCCSSPRWFWFWGGGRTEDTWRRTSAGWDASAFTVYNYAIYAFSIHFGPLFLVWIGVLGLSIFALLGSLATVDTSAIKACFAGRPLRWPGWFLIVVAALFTLLWLSEILPDLLAQRPSRSASQWNVPTSPVHVLDLAFFLPAAATTGVLVLGRHRWGYATVAGQLTWVALTCLPIMVTPLVADARGHQPGWAVIVPIGVDAAGCPRNVGLGAPSSQT